MPVLKSYTDGSGHYIHASVRGAVVTFQTTKHGVEKLTAAGVQLGVRFALRLLAEIAGAACEVVAVQASHSASSCQSARLASRAQERTE